MPVMNEMLKVLEGLEAEVTAWKNESKVNGTIQEMIAFQRVIILLNETIIKNIKPTINN